jgi:hypothetical protein
MASFRTDIMELIERQSVVAPEAALSGLDRAISQTIEQLGALVLARQVLLVQMTPPAVVVKSKTKGKKRVTTGSG